MDTKSPVAAAAPPSAVSTAAPENTIATVNSTGPASPHDVSQNEDVASTYGVGRRPGNLWTTEDREDMFNRREAGEGWETICADYPNRSRHAMQQQYSMMKKQKALADGTWASNRRGRKRRNPAPERTPAASKRSDAYGDGDEHMTEGDDFDEATSDEIDDPDDPSVRGPIGNGRPGALMRSSTEPVKSGRARNAAYATGPSLATNGNRASSQQAETQSEVYTPTGRQSKKRRLSSDQGPNATVTTPTNATDFQSPSVMLEYEEVFALLRRGVDNARRQGKNLENELAARATSYTQAIGRANRRANDAHERWSYATYEHGEAVKKLRSEFADTLKTKSREHKDAMDRLQADHDEERRALDNHVRSLSRQVHDLHQQLDLYKKDLPEREKSMSEQIDKLKADNLALEDAKREWESTAKTDAQPVIPQGESATDVLGLIGSAEAAVYAGCKSFNQEFDLMSVTISKFQAEIDDLNHKHIVQYLIDVVGLKDAAAQNMAALDKEVNRLHQAVADASVQSEKMKLSPKVTSLAAPEANTVGAVSQTPGSGSVAPTNPPPPSIHVQAPPAPVELALPSVPLQPEAEPFRHEGTDLTPIREEPTTPALSSPTTAASASAPAPGSPNAPTPAPVSAPTTAPVPEAAPDRADVEMQDSDASPMAPPPLPYPVDQPMPPPDIPAPQPASVPTTEASVPNTQ